jgi:hypothetical protein
MGLILTMLIPVLIMLAFTVFYIICCWKIFTKAGQPGWAIFVPIYNILVMLKIVGKPWWWLLLMLIPLVNFIILIIVIHQLSKVFGHGVGFTLGLIFLGFIFVPILALGNSQYTKPVVQAPAAV